MARFRSRPVDVEAVQWFPPGDPRHDPAMLSHRRGNAVDPPDYRRAGDLYQFSEIRGMGDDIFMLRTPKGDLKVAPGDWIVTGPGGDRTPIGDGEFAATYEPA